MIRKNKDNKQNYILSENGFPTYVFEKSDLLLGIKNIDKTVEQAYEKTYHLVDEANEDLDYFANDIASKFETKENSRELDFVRDLFRIQIKEGYNYGFSVCLDYDDIYFGGVSKEERTYIINHIKSHALMLMKQIASKVGLTQYKDENTKAQDSKEENLKQKIAELDSKIKDAVANNNQDDFIEFMNERNNLTRELMKFKNEQRKVKDESVYALDKNFTPNDKPMNLNEFFGIIQIGVKDFENKSFRVTKNPNDKYIVYDGDKELASNDTKGNIWFDDQIYGRYITIRKNAKNNKDLIEKINQTLTLPDMGRFPIQNIELTVDEMQKIFRNERGKTVNKVRDFYIKSYGETKQSFSINAEVMTFDFTKENGKEVTPSENLLNFLKTQFHRAFNKYGVAIFKFIVEGQLANPAIYGDFKVTLLTILNEHDADFDENFNGLNVEEIIEKFAAVLLNKQEKMMDSISRMERTETNYEVKLIAKKEEAYPYKKYFAPPYTSRDTGAWCITYGSNYDHYVSPSGADVFYFLLEKEWDKSKEVPHNDDTHYLDPYAVSMIAVAINKNGTVAKGVSRYNHSVRDTGGAKSTDNVYDEIQISKFLGQPYYEVLKPLHPENLITPIDPEFLKKEIAKIKINGVDIFKKGNNKIVQYNGEFIVFQDNLPLKDRRNNIFKFFNGLKVYASEKDKTLVGYLFYIKKEDVIYVVGFDANLKLVMTPKEATKKEDEIKKLKQIIQMENLG